MRSIRIKTIIAETKAFRNKIKSSCEIILHIAIDLERDTLKVDDMGYTHKRISCAWKKRSNIGYQKGNNCQITRNKFL